MRSLRTALALLALLTSTSATTLVDSQITLHADNVGFTCHQISRAVSAASTVYYPGDLEYAADIYHYAVSSTENATCSVRPGTTEDVGTILQTLAETQVPFGVKGGGHTMNSGFSSTSGVQIAMSRFTEVSYDASAQTVVVGAGLRWNEVYEQLDPHGVNVVGGRVSGVGVAGFTLGGGYSWLTNQHGLTLDNIVAYELVLPNGTAISVTEASEPDLYYGLRGGGYNNFGIITRFTFRTYPQGHVWGGRISILGDYADAVNTATTKFAAEVMDPKASAIMTYNFVPSRNAVIFSLLLFYDGAVPPSGMFDDLLAIPSTQRDIDTRSFADFVRALPSNNTEGYRGAFHTVPLMQLTPSIIKSLYNELVERGAQVKDSSAILLSYDIEPFHPDILAHGSPSAYPSSREYGYLPLNIYFVWHYPADDMLMRDVIFATADKLTSIALAEGQTQITRAPRYSNYAIKGTEMIDLYGDALGRLSTLKNKYDPQNVMGLAGGWKL